MPIEQLGHEAAELLSLTNGGEARSLNKLAELAAWQVPSCSVSGETVKVAVRKTISATARLACTAGQAARFTTLNTHEQAIPPAARTYATAAGPPGAR